MAVFGGLLGLDGRLWRCMRLSGGSGYHRGARAGGCRGIRIDAKVVLREGGR